MAEALDGAVGRLLQKAQLLPQHPHRLMVVAVYQRGRPQQLRKQSSGPCGVDQIPLRLLVSGDAGVERTTEKDVQCLHPPADAQNGAAAVGKGPDKKAVRGLQRDPDVPAAGQQQPVAAAGPEQVPAQHRLRPRLRQCRQIVAVLAACPIEIDLRFHSDSLLPIISCGGKEKYAAIPVARRENLWYDRWVKASIRSGIEVVITGLT